jgi:hypothetical protein
VLDLDGHPTLLARTDGAGFCSIAYVAYSGWFTTPLSR